MRKAKVFVDGKEAGTFTQKDDGQGYSFEYLDNYEGPAISLTIPCAQKQYEFTAFPAFFDGVLPEGSQLEALLRRAKLDRKDYFGQLVTVGADLIGAITVEEIK